MDLGEWEAMKNARKEAEEKIETLKRQVIDTALADPSSLVRSSHKLSREALKVVSYAMGMLGVSARNWPTDALLAVADGIESLVDADGIELELAREIRHFVRDALKAHESAARETIIAEGERIKKQQVLDAKNAALAASKAIATNIDEKFDDDLVLKIEDVLSNPPLPNPLPILFHENAAAAHDLAIKIADGLASEFACERGVHDWQPDPKRPEVSRCACCGAI